MAERRPRASAVTVCALAVLACSRSPEKPPPPRAAPQEQPAPSPLVSAVPVVPQTPLTLTVPAPGELTVRANQAVKIATLVDIEVRAANGRWKVIPKVESKGGYHALESCQPAPPQCRELAAGQTLVPPPWSGSSCSPQCLSDCRHDKFHDGVHRFVVKDCDEPTRRYESAEFTMPPSARSLARSRAARNIVQASIFRLDRGPILDRGFARNIDPNVDLAPDIVAGQRVLADTRLDLQPALVSELASWLQRESAFESLPIQRRCLPSTVVIGLLLRHSAAHGAERKDTEIRINLNCNSITFVTPDGRGRDWSSSYFDPSRAELLALLRRAMPQDLELAAAPEEPT